MILLKSMKKSLFIVLTAAIVIAGIIAAGIFFRQSPKDAVRTVTVERKDVTKDIVFTGRLSAEQSVTLGSEFPGIVTSVLVDVGDTVKEGQTLAVLDTRSAELELAKAHADRASIQDQRLIMFQNSENHWNNVKAENARSLERRRQDVRDAKKELDQEQTVWQQKVRESGDESSTARAAYAVVLLKQSSYTSAQQTLKELERTVKKVNDAAKAAMEESRSNYLATVQAARNGAGLSSVEALEQLATIKLQKNTITAPFDGVVTERSIERGQVIAPASSLLSVQTVDALEITADVTEVDASSVSVRNEASITFDALPPNEQWKGNVVRIAPAAKVIEGIPTYEITLSVSGLDGRHRPGLTVNVTVHADKRVGVIAIQQRAISLRDGRQTVHVRETDGTIMEREVTTGLIGSDGSVEVLQGVLEGEVLVVGTNGR